MDQNEKAAPDPNTICPVCSFFLKGEYTTRRINIYLKRRRLNFSYKVGVRLKCTLLYFPWTPTTLRIRPCSVEFSRGRLAQPSLWCGRTNTCDPSGIRCHFFPYSLNYISALRFFFPFWFDPTHLRSVRMSLHHKKFFFFSKDKKLIVEVIEIENFDGLPNFFSC